jgi:hypothetical protein
MLEASEARELIDEAVERLEDRDEAQQKAERGFRDRLSILVGVFAVLLAIVHLLGAGALRANLVATIHASDTYNYMQAKKIRQVILQTGAIAAPASERSRLLAEATGLDRPGDEHAIARLQSTAARLERDGERAGELGEHYEWAETALQMAIVLLSIAMIASSRAIAAGAVLIAASGVAIAIAAYSGLW